MNDQATNSSAVVVESLNLSPFKDASDSEIISKLRAGDTSGYAELVERYSDKVNNLALRITRNEEDAEEILQDVFITVYRKIDKFEGKSAFSSWLYRITVNTAFMKLRKRKKHASLSLEDSNAVAKNPWARSRSDVSDVSYMSSRHELRSMLECAISRLPEEYRVIFILRDVDGLSNQEVGELMDLSVPAVKSRLHRSRLMLRKRLQKFYDDYTNSERIFYGRSSSELVAPSPFAM